MQFKVSKDGRRGNLFSRVKFTANEQDGQRVVEGLAIVYGQLSDDRGGYKVRIAPGSVTYTEYVVAFLNHNTDLLIGNTSNDTLTLTDTDEGIYARIVLPNNVDGDKAWSWVFNQYATGMSFGCIPEDWVDTVEEGQDIRTYTSMLVDEVTITHSPAFTNAYVDVATDVDEQPVVAPVVADYSELDRAELELFALKLRGLRNKIQ